MIALFPVLMVLGSGRAAVSPPPSGNWADHYEQQMDRAGLRGRRVIFAHLSSNRNSTNQPCVPLDLSGTKLVWLWGICALPVVMVLRTQAKKKTAASDSEFQKILEVISADLVAGLSSLETGEVMRWIKPFRQYFGFEWAALFELLPDEFRIVPLNSDAEQAFTQGKRSADLDEADVGDPVVAVLGAGSDDILESFPGLKHELSQPSAYSYVVLPLRVHGELLGALVCGSVHQESQRPKQWTDKLQIIANILAGAVTRKRTEEALRSSEELKASILSSFTSSVAIIDRKGKLLMVNYRWLQFSTENGADSAATGPGANYLAECERAAEFGYPHAREALVGIKEVLEGTRARFEMVYPCHSPDEERWFHMVVTGLTRAEGGAVVKHNDITERTIAGSKLWESEHRFQLMADTAPVMIWMSGLDRLCTYFNRGWLDFTGRTLEQELGNGWADGIHPNDLQRCLQVYFAAFDAQRKFTMEYRLRRADGQYRWIIDSGIPRFVNENTFAGYIGCCFDITDRKELAVARTEFTGRLIKAQEEERARIARELHDDIGQRLALVAIEVQQLDGAFSGTKEALHARLHGLWKQINDISTDAGRISHQLHSSKLQLLGLALAIRSLCDDFSRQHHLVIDCRCTSVPAQMESSISLSLFRVAQEALHNIARHSHAKSVIVELAGMPNEVRLGIYDDGTGFDVDSALTGDSLGLISMTERLRLVGGVLSIRSEPSFGTRIDASVPLAAKPFPDSVPDRPNRNTAA